jgi:flagellar basal body P-ring formation protein FlgA
MRSSLLHVIRSGIFLACISCLLAPGLSLFGQKGSLGLADGLAHALPTVAEISVQANVAVSDKRLRLLDFCGPDTLPQEWKALLAEVDLGPAPEVGRETTFKPQQIAQHLERLITLQGFDLKQIAIRLPDKITVSRRQMTITREQIEAHFREFVLKKASWKTEDLVIDQISFGSLPALPPGQLTVEVTASPHERFVGNVSVTMRFSVDGKEVRNMRVSAKVELYQEVVHSVRAMKRDEVITEADIQSIRTNIAARPARYLSQPDQVVGKRLICSIGPNEPFGPRDLDQPSVIKRGDPVTVVYQQDGIRLSTRGEAKDKGGQGDRIRIRNLDSKKNILCQVIDSQTVEVLP